MNQELPWASLSQSDQAELLKMGTGETHLKGGEVGGASVNQMQVALMFLRIPCSSIHLKQNDTHEMLVPRERLTYV